MEMTLANGFDYSRCTWDVYLNDSVVCLTSLDPYPDLNGQGYTKEECKQTCDKEYCSWIPDLTPFERLFCHLPCCMGTHRCFFTGEDTGGIVWKCITENPTKRPTADPTSESSAPSHSPSLEPSFIPSNDPTINPTAIPTQPPSNIPTITTSAPSYPPTQPPSIPPTKYTLGPSKSPTNQPSFAPSTAPTLTPTQQPTFDSQTVLVGVETAAVCSSVLIIAAVVLHWRNKCCARLKFQLRPTLKQSMRLLSKCDKILQPFAIAFACLDVLTDILFGASMYNYRYNDTVMEFLAIYVFGLAALGAFLTIVQLLVMTSIYNSKEYRNAKTTALLGQHDAKRNLLVLQKCQQDIILMGWYIAAFEDVPQICIIISVLISFHSNSKPNPDLPYAYVSACVSVMSIFFKVVVKSSLNYCGLLNPCTDGYGSGDMSLSDTDFAIQKVDGYDADTDGNNAAAYHPINEARKFTLSLEPCQSQSDVILDEDETEDTCEDSS